MVAIPDYGDPTLAAMERAVEALQKGQQDRDYLGASLIGEPCARKIWYNYNKFPRRPSSFIGLVASECGHWSEAITAERLRMVKGIELHTHDPNGNQYGWVAAGGKMRGHFDGLIRGLIQAPKAIHIWEHKDKDHKKFSDFQNKKQQYGEKETLKKWNELYYAQAQMNMHFARIGGIQVDRHYMTVSYAGGRKYDSCRTNYDPAFADELVNKALTIIEARSAPAPISDKPDFYLCRFCDFRDLCHGNQN